MTPYRLVRNRIRLALSIAKAKRRYRPERSFMKFLPEKQRNNLKTIKKWLRKSKRKARAPLQDLKLDKDGRYTLPIDLNSRWNRASRLQPYEAMLRSFYEGHAVTQFERIADDPQTVGRLVQASWALARWHWSSGRFEKTHSRLEGLRTALPKARWPDGFLAVEARTLAQLGRTDEALERASSDNPKMRLVRFSILRQADRDADICLEPLNALYQEQNFVPIRRRDRNQALSISNLIAKADPDPRAHEAQVSVVMPAFEAEKTIDFAIDGILRQSWTNLELIVVDDASEDRTWRIICERAKSDPRIRPIRQPENRGTYAARNAGLHAARGCFVTINDADDWSHPERLALQVRAMLADSLSNATCGARVSSDLQLSRPTNYRSPSTFNLSSLLFDRRIAQKLNGWDLTRFAADSEFRHRYERHVGATHRKLVPDVPLAWLLTSERSLTQSNATGLKSLHYGARQQYREAYQDWHAHATSLRLGETRAFPAPRIALTQSPAPITCDELFISDFSSEASVDADLDAITQAIATHRRIALLHLPRLEHFNEPVDERIRSLTREHTIPIGVPGESITSKRATVLDPSGLKHLPAARALVTSDAASIYADNFALLSSSLGDEGAKARIAEVVGREPDIVRNTDVMIETP